MKTMILAGIGAALLLLSGMLLQSARAEKQKERVLRHVVMFKFKSDATAEQVKAVEAAFAELPSKIDVIRDFEWGTNNSPEDLAQGFTHCFLVTFGSEADRETYLPHPEHQAFVKLLRPILDEALVVDYWAEK